VSNSRRAIRANTIGSNSWACCTRNTSAALISVTGSVLGSF
jgi:hypothetical protein